MRQIERHEIDDEIMTDISCRLQDMESDPPLITTLTHPNPTTALLLTSKPVIHRAEAGVNPLVDAGGYLFSLMGKLKHLKKYKNLAKLHQELVQEIENFQATIEIYNDQSEYLSEYLPISLYALCMTIDDIIASTPWGGQGQWEQYSLIAHFNQDTISAENFLIILERLVLDPAIYIDVMEFIYICLSLGFKCHNASEFSYEQLEKITNSLYKRIRIHRGNFSKTLSPFAPRTLKHQIAKKPIPHLLSLGLLAIGFLLTAWLVWNNWWN